MKQGLAALVFFLAWGVSEGSQAKPEQPEIIIDQGAAKMTMQMQQDLVRKLRPILQGRGGATGRGVAAATLSAFLQPEEVSRITVDLYNPQATAWSAPEPWSAESIKREIQFVLTARTENGVIAQGINWSEGNSWSVAATVSFKSGKQGKLYLDGLHVCYEAPDSHYFFFRLPGNRPWMNTPAPR